MGARDFTPLTGFTAHQPAIQGGLTSIGPIVSRRMAMDPMLPTAPGMAGHAGEWEWLIPGIWDIQEIRPAPVGAGSA